MSSDWLEIIRTAANALGAAALAVGVAQWRLQMRIWQTNHQRARGEKAIEVIRHFNATIDAKYNAVIKLVERLDRDQLKSMDDSRPFSVNASLAEYICTAIPGFKAGKSDQPIVLSSKESALLRFHALEALNSIEIVCQAWLLDVADRKTIEDEIQFLYDEHAPEPRTLMKNYRNVFGGEKYYPALYRFINYIESERRRNSEKNGPSPPIVQSEL